MDRIVVTGFPGWLGRVLVTKLVTRSAGVRLLVSPDIERKVVEQALPPEARDDIELLQGDLRDPACLSEAVRGMDIVYHLAAVQHPGRVSEIYAVNARATGALAQVAAEADVQRFIFVSSSSVHGANATDEPITEATPMHGLTHYALSKIEGERLLASVAAQSGLHSVIIRPGVFYGLNPSPNMQKVIEWLKTRPGPVFGKDGQNRIYVDIEKVADVLLAATERGSTGQAYLIGDRQPLTTRQFYTSLCEGLEVNTRIVSLPVSLARMSERLTFAGGRLLDIHIRLGNVIGEFGRCHIFQSRTADELGVEMHESSRPGLRAMARLFKERGGGSSAS